MKQKFNGWIEVSYDKEITWREVIILQSWNVFDGTPGGIKLLITVDAFNGHINWSVQEGDHYTDFKDFEEARDYYLKVTGN